LTLEIVTVTLVSSHPPNEIIAAIMRNRLTHSLLCLQLAAAVFGAPSPSTAQVVARIGDVPLTLQDFENRARRLHSSGYQHLQTIDLNAKRQLLEDIIAQELLVLEGRRQGAGDDPVIAADLARRELRALTKALYETQALQGDYTSTEEQLRTRFFEQQYDVEVFTRQIVCASEEEARIVADELAAGASFDTLVARHSLPSVRQRFGSAGWTGWLRLGTLHKELREPLNTMPVDTYYPDPVKTSLGYHVFGLKARRTFSFESSVESFRKKLRKQAEAKDIAAYVSTLRDRYAIEMDEEGLKTLAQIDSTESTTASDQTLATWQGGQLTISDYMDLVSASQASHPARIDRPALQRKIDSYVGQQVVMAEARRLGLDRKPEVRRRIEGKRRELFATWLFEREAKRRAQIDTSDANVRRYYEENVDLHTPKDGQAPELAKVASRIRSSMVRRAQTAAMDQFIAELREQFADQIDIDEAVLDQAVLDQAVLDDIPPAGTAE